MRLKLMAIFSAAAVAASTPVSAQMPNESEGEALLKAVRDGDSSTAASLIETPGSRLATYRGYGGDTALHIVTKQRNLTWVRYLLGRGASANVEDKNGETPLMLASKIGFTEAVDTMVRVGTNVDATNRRGETALIVAVQQRQPRIVKMLLEAGANPDKADHAAGLSARDYARRDSRNTELLKLIETTKSLKKKAVSGPKL